MTVAINGCDGIFQLVAKNHETGKKFRNASYNEVGPERAGRDAPGNARGKGPAGQPAKDIGGREPQDRRWRAGILS